MYIKYISQIWIRLVQCISIWHTLGRIGTFAELIPFCLSNTNNFDYIRLLLVQYIAHFQRVIHVYKRGQCV